MSKKIVAVYQNELNIGQTGLTPFIRIWNLDITPPSIILSSGVMTEIGEGAYYYNFTTYTGTVSYLFRCDGGSEMDGLNRYVWSTNENDPASIASGVWDAQRSDHTTDGTFGEGYSDTSGWTVTAG